MALVNLIAPTKSFEQSASYFTVTETKPAVVRIYGGEFTIPLESDPNQAQERIVLQYRDITNTWRTVYIPSLQSIEHNATCLYVPWPGVYSVYKTETGEPLGVEVFN